LVNFGEGKLGLEVNLPQLNLVGDFFGRFFFPKELGLLVGLNFKPKIIGVGKNWIGQKNLGEFF